MKRYASVLGALLLVSTVPVPAETRLLSVTVVGANEDDRRWAAAEEAVHHWNGELARAGAGLRLGRIIRRIEPVDERGMRAMSDDIVRRGWSRSVPQNLRRIPGDILVVLSDSDLISFGMRGHGRRGLIGLRRADVQPLSLPNVLRNVVAHELGHVLGLGHNSDPTTLMCGRPAACRPDMFFSNASYFFPLTEEERARLRGR